MSSFIHKYSQQLTILALTLLMIFAAAIRFKDLAKLPATLNRDEAALAYNAYLLERTGKDEWGRSWPVSLESFGDYKLPGYPLLLVGTFKLFGENDFAVRLPSAVAGTILVGLAYVFARKVLNLYQGTSLFVAASVAVQPVFFFYSRMAWEANVALAFFVSAVILFLFPSHSKKTQLRTDILGILLCVLAIFTYNTPLLLLPFLGIAVLFQRGLKNWKRSALAVGGLAILFVVGFITFASVSQQKSGITIFSDETTWRESVIYHDSFSGISQKLIGNRYVFFGKVIFQHYLESIGPVFLVERGGGHPWHTLPGTGHLYLTTYGLAILAVLRLLWLVTHFKSSRATRVTALTLLFLLFTALIPAVITVDAPHATRSLFFFFLACVFSGISLEWMWKLVSGESEQKQALQIFFVGLLLIGGIAESNRYLHRYFTLYPSQSATILKAGLDTQLTKMEANLGTSNDQVAIVDPDGFLYTTVAWELKIPPEEFFATINHHLPDRIGLKYGYRVGRYRFIAHREDRVPEDKHIIEWDPDLNRWITDSNL